MTGLLVSVRSGDEARHALAGGADVIDVKEPLLGSLGAAEPRVWDEVLAVVGQAVPVSVALGELRSFSPVPIPTLIRYAKLGLAGCRELRDWPERWAAALRTLPLETTPVAVAYADYDEAAAPTADEVFERGRQLGCGGLLLDTFDKTRGGLFDLWSEERVRTWVESARGAGMLVVLAGSLDRTTARRAAQLAPDLIAVRGAVCRASRVGPIDVARIRSLQQDLASPFAATISHEAARGV